MHRGQLTPSECRHCGEKVVYVDEVGWFDPDLTHSYDICPGDPYGNHAVWVPGAVDLEEIEDHLPL